MNAADLSFLKPETRNRCRVFQANAEDEAHYFGIDASTLTLLYSARAIDFSIFLRVDSNMIEFMTSGEVERLHVHQLMNAIEWQRQPYEVLIRTADIPKLADALEHVKNKATNATALAKNEAGKTHGVFARLLGHGGVVGKRAPDFVLQGIDGSFVDMPTLYSAGPLLIIFYPGDFARVCTRQMCNYRDKLSEFTKLGIQLVGISHNSVEDHQRFRASYNIKFPLLSDPGHEVAKMFGCTSVFLLGGVSRATFVVNRQQIILYRYVEPTTLTRRRSDELVAVIEDLRNNKLL